MPKSYRTAKCDQTTSKTMGSDFSSWMEQQGIGKEGPHPQSCLKALAAQE